MIDLGPSNRVVVTGAGGWLGREFLEVLARHYSPAILQNCVVCLGSSTRTIILSTGTPIQIHAMSTFLPEGEISGFVHLAFQTRDKVSVLGHSDYCFSNLQITSRAIQLIENMVPKWIATVSSGAILLGPGGPLENDVSLNPYGFAKRIEETLLQSVATSIGANLAIARLWSAMGKFMPPNPAYAISDFITSGLQGKEITVLASNRVWRRYVDAGELMNVLTSAAERQTLTVFDSGGDLIELGELAKLVAGLIQVDVAKREMDTNQPEDTYYPSSKPFEKLAHSFEVEISGLEPLVQRTLLGHRLALGVKPFVG
jgi:nucleoside-diphosphate-sugar epimerase